MCSSRYCLAISRNDKSDGVGSLNLRGTPSQVSSNSEKTAWRLARLEFGMIRFVSAVRAVVSASPVCAGVKRKPSAATA